MARERMVTRTVTMTTAKVMQIDITTAEVSIREYTLAGEHTPASILKTLTDTNADTPDIKYVNVEASSTSDVLYGMSEELFIAQAKVLPPR